METRTAPPRGWPVDASGLVEVVTNHMEQSASIELTSSVNQLIPHQLLIKGICRTVSLAILGRPWTATAKFCALSCCDSNALCVCVCQLASRVSLVLLSPFPPSVNT